MALPSAPIITLAPNASLQPPLSRRGHGPGIVIVDTGLPESPAEKTVDPVPQKKWAEEGYAVARLTYAKAGTADGAWPIETALEQAVDALAKLDTCDTKNKFALIVYGTPADYPADFTAKFQAAFKSTSSIIASVSFSPEWDLSSNPELVHSAGKAVSPLSRPNTSTYDYPQVKSDKFIVPGAEDFHYSAASVAHTRSLTLLKKQLEGPIFDLEKIWDEHTYYEFEDRSVEKTMATMVDEPYVNHIPTMTGGVGRERLTNFYRHHFIFNNPENTTMELVSRTVGIDRVVDEFVFTLTHTQKVDWLFPGVPPTGKHLRLPFSAVVNIRGDRLYHEHISWDQCTALVQAGLMPEYLTFPYAVDGKEPEPGKKFEYRVPAAGHEVPAKLQDQGAAASNAMFEFDVRQVDA
ncbi:putative SnoaL-like domain-containing protein [Seiridium cardinale]|uniref:SnoaL-like domain-containing protein n=1 Tax=Seiridium cardinale TaxID=138064 RepID=A0ABR2XVD4_9PEZI